MIRSKMGGRAIVYGNSPYFLNTESLGRDGGLDDADLAGQVYSSVIVTQNGNFFQVLICCESIAIKHYSRRLC